MTCVSKNKNRNDLCRTFFPSQLRSISISKNYELQSNVERFTAYINFWLVVTIFSLPKKVDKCNFLFLRRPVDTNILEIIKPLIRVKVLKYLDPISMQNEMQVK